jgi:hypothetical protein
MSYLSPFNREASELDTGGGAAPLKRGDVAEPSLKLKLTSYEEENSRLSRNSSLVMINALFLI